MARTRFLLAELGAHRAAACLGERQPHLKVRAYEHLVVCAWRSGEAYDETVAVYPRDRLHLHVEVAQLGETAGVAQFDPKHSPRKPVVGR
jgi:hypothetical protein